MADYIVLGFTIVGALLLIATIIDTLVRYREATKMQELIQSLPWADPAKLIQDADFQPILIQQRKDK